MKKASIVSFVLIVIMAILTGCSGGEKNKKEETEPVQDTQKESEEDIVITMMFSGTVTDNDFETVLLPKLVKEKMPNVTLEVTKLPDDQYYTALKTKLASGEAPDIILVQPKYAGANSVIGLAEADYLVPLSDMELWDKIGKVGTESVEYNGEIYGIPGGVSILGTYYNKDIFDEYNLEVPTSWDEFLNVCEVLKSNGIQPIVMGDKDMYVMQFGLYQLAANEVYPKNPNYDDQLRTGEVKFTDEGTWDKVLEMYTSLYDKGYIDKNSLGLSAQQAIQKFVDGQAAMTFDGSFNAPAITAEGAVSFERGYFPLPGENNKAIYASMAMGAGPAITKDSKYIEECKAILTQWYDGESDIWHAYIDSGRVIPTYGYGSDQINPLFSNFVELHNDGYSFYWCNQGWPSGVEGEMESRLSEYIGGVGTSVDDITESMQHKFEELLDQ